MLNGIFKYIIISFIAVFVMVSFASCQKAKDTIGVIIVKDSDGNAVAGAKVVLHQDGMISPQGLSTNPDLRKTNNTDANGRAQFTYELEAILNVEVLKQSGNNTLTGNNIIRLLKGKTVTKIVEVN